LNLSGALRLAVPVWFACCGLGACAEETTGRGTLPAKYQKLLPLHKELGQPGPADWLAHHPEPGQTYRQYLDCGPVIPNRQRRTIYVQPLGDFTRTQRRIIELAAEYMHCYFDLPVEIREDLPLDLIPESARRKHPSWGMDQILSTYVLHNVLYTRLPKDAMALIAFTASDLWPGEGWNFVFGQASLKRRVGVWSLYRFGDPDESDEAFQLCLKRTIKTATHETGHMFSMRHCIQYQCNMCGSNHLVESDNRPLWLCPHCLAKLCWATKTDPLERFRQLAAFCKEHGLEEERAFFEKSLAALRRK
jgi:archaemetzincin